MDFVLDLAGLSYLERRSAVPIMWSSGDIVVGAKSATPRQFNRLLDEIDPTCVNFAVRWGDPRLDDLLEQLRQRLSLSYREAEQPYINLDYGMHGRRIVVVLNDELHEVHLIPKSLGTHLVSERDECEPCGLAGMRHISDEFDAVRYHHGLATVAGWSEASDIAKEQLVGRRNRSCSFYLKLERYVGVFQMAVSIDA